MEADQAEITLPIYGNTGSITVPMEHANYGTALQEYFEGNLVSEILAIPHRNLMATPRYVEGITMETEEYPYIFPGFTLVLGREYSSTQQTYVQLGLPALGMLNGFLLHQLSNGIRCQWERVKQDGSLLGNDDDPQGHQTTRYKLVGRIR